MIDFNRLVNGPGMRIFGVRVKYLTMAGQETMLVGVFDRDHVEVGIGQDGAPISASRSQIRVRLSEWGSPRQGDGVDVRIRRGQAVHIDDVPDPADVVLHYVVSDVQHDSIGSAMLILGARSLAAQDDPAGSLPFTPGAQVLGA